MENYCKNIDDWDQHDLTYNETLLLVKWLKNHLCYCKEAKEFILAKTHKSGIGQSTIIKCKVCGTGYDITEYEVW